MLHVELDRDLAHHPYYLQILEQIRSSILAGELAAGSQLPPSRQLAIELGICDFWHKLAETANLCLTTTSTCPAFG